MRAARLIYCRNRSWLIYVSQAKDTLLTPKGETMASMLTQLRATSDHKAAGAIRIFLGLMMASTGLMKMLVPSLGAAFAGQLQAAGQLCDGTRLPVTQA